MQVQEFNYLVDQIKDKMYRLAYRIVKDSEEARDVVQDALVKVWTIRDRLEDVENKEAYIMTMTRNMAIDKYRSNRMHTSDITEHYDMESPADNPERLAIVKDAYNRVEKVINALPENHRTVVQLRDIEGYSYNEICEITGYSLEQVKVYLHRARIKLKAHFKNKVL